MCIRDRLEPGDQVIVSFTVEVDPDANGTAAVLDNQAVATGDGQDENGDPILDSMGNPVGAMDDSDSGADPASDNPGEPGDTGGIDDPTPLQISDIGVGKQVNTVTPTAISGVFDVEYVVVVENTGTVDLANIQITEDFTAEFGAAFDSVQTPLTVTSSSLTGAAVLPNMAGTAWDGAANTTFFDGTSGLLEPGNSITLTFTVRVQSNADDTTAPNDFTNQVLSHLHI